MITWAQLQLRRGTSPPQQPGTADPHPGEGGVCRQLQPRTRGSRQNCFLPIFCMTPAKQKESSAGGGGGGAENQPESLAGQQTAVGGWVTGNLKKRQLPPRPWYRSWDCSHTWDGSKVSMWKGTWVAQSVQRLTLGFSSAHDLRGMGLSPASGSATGSTLGVVSGWNSLPLRPPRPPALSLALSRIKS